MPERRGLPLALIKNPNQKGSILLTALIMIATSAIVIGYLSVSMTSDTKERINVTKSIQMDILSRSLQNALMIQSQCPSLLPGATYKGIDISVPTLQVAGKTYQSGTVISGDFKIASLSLAPILTKPPVIVSPGSTQYFATLAIDYDGGPGWIKKDKTSTTQMRITTDNVTGQIQSCAEENFFQVGLSQGPTCTPSGLTYSGAFTMLGSTYNIYYMIYKGGSGVYYYCIVPSGGTLGYMTACTSGRCPWN